ncbi:unnamed protein product [Caenorhabditis auriculariae]|uniref:uridine/cytidine kinase n=1 Tax=Caenorhabditis auriculariae TaxID=2777116 RepID=A0A8S1HVN1_9PELO|nr:unnamed protein product [Caenorhabditis auriculariae]
MESHVFVDTDADLRLARRLNRDINERARELDGVLEQYFKFVKPAFDLYIAPGMKDADIIVPRGGDNDVAINLIVKKVMAQLLERGYDRNQNHVRERPEPIERLTFPDCLPDNLIIIRDTPQVKGLHTYIRSRDTNRDEFIFYSERLSRILFEEAMNHMPYQAVDIELVNGCKSTGIRKAASICGVAIMRAGETMENSLRNIVKDCKMGKILIQTNETTLDPELHYLRLPVDIHDYKVILMDATVATGNAAMMAIRILLDHDVTEENIYLCSLVMSEQGAHSLAYAFPKVKLITTAMDELSHDFFLKPGMGNFGDRYYGTCTDLTFEEPLEV